MNGPRKPWTGGGLFSRSGRLEDFQRRTGDPPVGQPGVLPSARQKWGGRDLISNFSTLNALGVRKKVTIIATGDLGVPTPVNIQLRFAKNSGGNVLRGNPLLPFEYPVHGSATRIKVTVRRGVDPTSSPTVDEYQLVPTGATTGDVLPIDTCTAREIGVEVEAEGFGADDTTTFVEGIASPVADIGPKNEVHPWDVAQNPAFKNASAGAITLLLANSDREQFFIVNTSTDADLIVQMGRGPNNASPQFLPFPLGTIFLPRNISANYESPCPCGFKGTVFGIWSSAGNGGAMVHEGTVF